MPHVHVLLGITLLLLCGAACGKNDKDKKDKDKGGCSAQLLNNSLCDYANNVFVCGWDGGDCASNTSNCTLDTEGCEEGDSDCGHYNTTCTSDCPHAFQTGSEYGSARVWAHACSCTYPSIVLCLVFADSWLLCCAMAATLDSICDAESNTDQCSWDGGDCCPASCFHVRVVPRP